MTSAAFTRRSVLRLLIVGLSATAVAACSARGPKATDAMALADPVSPSLSRLVFIVPQGPFPLAAKADVFVNGRRVGPLREAGVFYADVYPGTQVVSVNTEMALDTAFFTAPGEVAYVRMGGDAGYLIGFVRPERIPEDEGIAALQGKRMAEWR